MARQGSRVTRRRILVTRLITWPLAVVIILLGSRWDEHVVFKGLLFFFGCMFVTAATLGRLWCSLYICGYKTKQLVTSGPYSLCRNPLYLFSVIGVVGVGLATETMTIPLLLALFFALFYPTVIRDEEAELAVVHGEAFKEYISSVPRFWPRSLKIQEPSEYKVDPVRFRRAMIDAMWFVGFLGLLEFSEALRDAGVLPTIAWIY